LSIAHEPRTFTPTFINQGFFVGKFFHFEMKKPTTLSTNRINQVQKTTKNEDSQGLGL
jgi:hypothetical protein